MDRTRYETAAAWCAKLEKLAARRVVSWSEIAARVIDSHLQWAELGHGVGRHPIRTTVHKLPTHCLSTIKTWLESEEAYYAYMLRLCRGVVSEPPRETQIEDLEFVGSGLVRAKLTFRNLRSGALSEGHITPDHDWHRAYTELRRELDDLDEIRST